jgi:hypothetical protein
MRGKPELDEWPELRIVAHACTTCLHEKLSGFSGFAYVSPAREG